MTSTRLSTGGEQAWQSLRTHLEWASGFWLGWIFTNHPPSGQELFDRTAELLGPGRRCELRRPREPGELTTDTTAWLFGDAARIDGCVAVLVAAVDEPWARAWDQFLLRLNLRRDWLRQHLRGGLLLIAPAAFKPRSRATAPDLWSIRSLVFDVSPPPSPGLEAHHPASAQHDEESVGNAELSLALQAIAAAQAAGQPQAETDARIRAARALLASDQREEAREQAMLAVQLAPAPARARALASLGALEEDLGDAAAAERRYSAALDLDPDALTAADLRALASLLARRGALDRALDVAERAWTRSRRDVSATSESPQAHRDEMLSLLSVGNIQWAMRAWSAAAKTFEAALALCRRLSSTEGGTWRALQDEAICLYSLGYARWHTGDWTTAANAFDASLALLRRVRATVGDTPTALRNEFIVLVFISQLRQESGDLAAALEAADAGLALLVRRRAVVGETSELLRDESTLWSTIGDIRRTLRDWTAAADAHERAAALSNQLRAIAGDTPDTLRDEAFRRQRLASVQGLSGDWAAAEASFAASLDLFRRGRAMTGDNAELQRDLALCLSSFADALAHQGRPADARAALDEAEALLREVVAADPSPPVLEALADVQQKLAATSDSSEPTSST